MTTQELPLLLGGALAGSAHCAGMCGGFVAAFGMRSTCARAAVASQLGYQAGRASMYGMLGAMAGQMGLWVKQIAFTYSWFQASLAIAAGVVLVYQAARQIVAFCSTLPAPTGAQRVKDCAPAGPTVIPTDALSRNPVQATSQAQSAGRNQRSGLASALSPLFQGSGLVTSLLAGMATGLLPCGLTYSYLLLAAASQSSVFGALIMLTLVIGSAPILMLIGFSGRLVPVKTRQWAVLLAAGCLMIQGVVTIDRGLGRLWYPTEDVTACDPIHH